MHATPDTELMFLLKITRHLPPLPYISGISNRIIKPFYLRKPRAFIAINVLNFKMILDPKECVDGNLLFIPHLYDRHEVRTLSKWLQPGDTFIDIGANIGFYSLLTSYMVGSNGKVISIEADPTNFDRLVENILFNKANNIVPINYGVSDKTESIQLGICTTGNRGGNSFLRVGNDHVEVQCHPLLNLLQANNIHRIDALKIDIEGFEYRVLSKFFNEVPTKLYPRLIIIEHIPEMSELSGGNNLDLLYKYGYRLISKHGVNYIMTNQ